ncbi:MAG TPA: LamG-like jellyroll fold domain-containing protein [Kofleriaceae bacterium]|nr:LamG-like jellyroll fold domain-containing protein [Kofleriaceae bacterium]
MELVRTATRLLPLVVASSASLLAGCTAIFGLDAPHRLADAASADSPTLTDTSRSDAAPVGYHATAVRFDPAGGDFLTTGTLAGSTTSGQGTFSVWLHFNGGDGSAQMIAAAQVLASGGIFRNANNKLQFQLNACGGGLLLDVQSAHAYTASSGWIHVLASWDLAASRVQLYVNGVPDLAAGGTIANGAICYTAPKWGIGGLSSASLDADVADWYASFGTAVNLDVVANRAKFRTVAGKPVDLGADCSNATGVTPIACLTGALAQWSINKGTGGGFALHGDGLSAAPTSPSD